MSGCGAADSGRRRVLGGALQGGAAENLQTLTVVLEEADQREEVKSLISTV